jgi:site-specific recombinase XerD
VFLTPAEVERFVEAINLTNLDGSLCWPALRFRALVEALLGSAMRIGELLSLDRAHLDLVNREAKIVGKGNKERVAFFTQRAVLWLQQYLNTRQDSHPALFVCRDGRSRLKRDDIWRPFTRYRKLSGVSKPVTPHLLRHTAATQLLFNGCPIGHIKEILGHERLETTCRYYLGLDRRAAKQAHQRYLTYTQEDGDSDAGFRRALVCPSEPLTEPTLATDLSVRPT